MTKTRTSFRVSARISAPEGRESLGAFLLDFTQPFFASVGAIYLGIAICSIGFAIGVMVFRAF